MKVEDVQIDDDYIKVNASDSILDVAKKIAKKGIPDAVVIKEEKVVGALDDYDIISKVIAPEKDLKTMKAEDIMFACPPIHLDTELSTVHEIMEKLEATMLPVTDDKKALLGVITIMDVLEGMAVGSRSFLDKLLGR